MTFNWPDYIEIAKYIHSKGKNCDLNQACFRCAISRSYYAAFIISKKYAERKGAEFPFDDTKSHKKVIDFFINSENPHLQDIGEDLKNLKLQRVQSDYKDNYTFTSLAVENVIRMSKNIIEDLGTT